MRTRRKRKAVAMKKANRHILTILLLFLLGGCVPMAGFRVCLKDKDVEDSSRYKIGERYMFLLDTFVVWSSVYKTHYAVVPHSYSCQGEVFDVPDTVEEWQRWKEEKGKEWQGFEEASFWGACPTNDFPRIRFVIPRNTVCEIVGRNVCYYWSVWYGFGTYPSTIARCEMDGKTIEVALNCLTSFKTGRPISKYLKKVVEEDREGVGCASHGRSNQHG